MAERILEVEYRPGEEVVLRIKAPKGSLLPEATRSHARMARKELLLGLRSLLDSAIESLEKREKEGEKKREKIEVE